MTSFDPDTHQRFKEELYTEFARIAQALASPRRLEMLDLLVQRERPVEDLAEEMGLTVTNASQHLQVLLRVRLVEVRRQGTYAYYRLADGQVYGAWRVLRELAEDRLSEVGAVVRRYLGERVEIGDVDLQKLQERVKAGQVTLVDVRPAEEYQEAHLPGARSLPLAEMEELLEALPKDCEVVAYCRGPYCTFSDEAVELLRRHGFEAYRLGLGPADWKAHGFPVEVTPAERTEGYTVRRRPSAAEENQRRRDSHDQPKH